MDATAGLRFGGGRRLPVFLQTEAAECGLASLGMVASFHGHRIDLAGLRQRFTLSLKGATLAYLMQVAGRLHLAPRPLRLELDELPQLRTPCILHWDLNHFVVLQSASSREARDPRSGVRREAPGDGGSLEALHRHRPRARADRRLPSRSTSGAACGCAT